MYISRDFVSGGGAGAEPPQIPDPAGSGINPVIQYVSSAYNDLARPELGPRTGDSICIMAKL